MVNVFMRLRGVQQPFSARVEPMSGVVHLPGRQVPYARLAFDVPTTGAVYGTLFNFPATLAALGEKVHAAPYQQPPRAPVLYIKPANTWIGAGIAIPLPSDVPAIEVGATLGVVIGHTASRVHEKHAYEFVAGYTLVNDVSVPHDSFYRPPLRQKCRDGFCPIGPWIVLREHVSDPGALNIRAYVNGELRQLNTTSVLSRSIPRLIADVTEFMTLYEGDVLTIGVPENAPLARAGDVVTVEIEGIGRLENPVIAEADWPVGDLR